MMHEIKNINGRRYSHNRPQILAANLLRWVSRKPLNQRVRGSTAEPCCP